VLQFPSHAHIAIQASPKDHYLAIFLVRQIQQSLNAMDIRTEHRYEKLALGLTKGLAQAFPAGFFRGCMPGLHHIGGIGQQGGHTGITQRLETFDTS